MFGDLGGMTEGMAALSMVQSDLFRGVGSYEEWRAAALEAATGAQAALRHHLEQPAEPNRQQLAQSLDLLGREAQRLAIVAENRQYGEEEAELMRRLDQVCLDYTHRAGDADAEREERLREDLPAVVSDVFAALDSEAPDGSDA